jgi:hypothetical protein
MSLTNRATVAHKQVIGLADTLGRMGGWVGAPLYLSAHAFQSAINRILAKIGSADRAATIQHARGDDIDMDRRGTLTVRCRLSPADLRLPFSCWGRPRGR